MDLSANDVRRRSAVNVNDARKHSATNDVGGKSFCQKKEPNRQ